MSKQLSSVIRLFPANSGVSGLLKGIKRRSTAKSECVIQHENGAK